MNDAMEAICYIKCILDINYGFFGQFRVQFSLAARSDRTFVQFFNFFTVARVVDFD